MPAWLVLNCLASPAQLTVAPDQAPELGHALSPETPLQPQDQAMKLQLGPDDAFPVIGYVHQFRVLEKNPFRKAMQQRSAFLERADARRAHVVGIVAAAPVLDAVGSDPLFWDKKSRVKIEA